MLQQHLVPDQRSSDQPLAEYGDQGAIPEKVSKEVSQMKSRPMPMVTSAAPAQRFQ